MALRVGELFATLKLDSKGFDDGLDKSKRSFDGLRTGVEKGVKTTATAFAASTTAVAGLGIAALKVGLDYNRLQQSSRAALSTLLGGAEAANAQMDKLDDFARTSPFAKQVFITAQQQLLGFGVAAEDVIPTLDAVQNAVAAVGGGNEEVSAITYALAQMQGQGKLTGQTLNQLGQYGIDAATIVGEKMGMTGEEVRKLASKPGGIPVKDVFKPLTDGLIERFGGATDAIKEQMDGAADRVKGAWRDIGAAMAKPLIDPHGGGMLVDWTNAFADSMRALEAQIKPTVDILVKRYQPALDAVTPALQKVKGAIDGWDVRKINVQLDEMGKYAPLIAGTATALFTLGSTSLPIIGRFLPVINPLVAGLGALVAFSPELRALGGDFFTALAPLVPVAKDLGRVLADTLMEALHRLTPAIGDVLMRGADLAVLFGTALAPTIVNVLDASLPLVGVLADLVSWIAELPTPVLLTVAALTAMRSLNIGPLLNTTIAGGFRAIKSGAETAALQMMYVRDGAGGLRSAMQPLRGAISGVGTALRSAFVANAPMLAITALIGAIGAFATAQAEAKQRTEEYKQTLDQFGNITLETVDKINTSLSRDRTNWAEKLFGGDANSLIDDADRLGVAVEDLMGYILGEEDAIERVTAATREYSDARQGSTREYNDAMGYVNRFTDSLDQEARALTDAEKEVQRKRRADIAAGVAEREAKESADRYTESLKEQSRALEEQYDKQRQASGAVLNASESIIRYNETVGKANETIKENGKNLDLNTEKGRKNQSALNDLARAGLDNVDAMRENNATSKELREAMQRVRDDFIRTAKGAGASADEARHLADELGLIPSSVTTSVNVNTANAYARLDALQRKLNATAGQHVVIPYSSQTHKADGGIVTRYANGGIDEAGRYVPRISQIVTGGRNILWGEPETGWESYISGKPSARQRNLAVMDETAKRLGGVFVRPMANGGTLAGATTATGGAGSLTGLAIEGTLDLGDGLVGVLRGVVRNEISDQVRSVNAGVRL